MRPEVVCRLGRLNGVIQILDASDLSKPQVSGLRLSLPLGGSEDESVGAFFTLSSIAPMRCEVGNQEAQEIFSEEAVLWQTAGEPRLAFPETAPWFVSKGRVGSRRLFCKRLFCIALLHGSLARHGPGTFCLPGEGLL